MCRLDFFVALNRPLKAKLWPRILTQLTVGTWWIDMPHLVRAFPEILHLFSTYKSTRKPLLGNLFISHSNWI